MSRMITRIVTTVPSPMYIGSPPQRGDPRRGQRGRLVGFHLLGRPPLPGPDGPKLGIRLGAALRENARVERFLTFGMREATGGAACGRLAR
jgi:hypothetical protein